MANRSDFFSAKLPRRHKRMFAIAQTYGFIKDNHEYGKLKRLYIEAHANHVGFKLKRQSIDNSNADSV